MSDAERTGFDKFPPTRRKAVRITPEAMVSAEEGAGVDAFPLVLRPQVEDLNLAEWARHNRGLVEAQLLRHGALLFRDFNVGSAQQFEGFARALCPELLGYQERAAPRSEVQQNIYTSTEYPADQHIPLHHEMSYSHNWPTKIWFYCLEPAERGGRTPVADDRKVFDLIDPAVKRRFMEKRVMYVRNYGEGVDLSWQEAFQTEEKSAVEEYCRKARTEFEWRDGDRLRTRQVRQAVATHPRTGDTVWFNHAHMFHHSNLQPEVRESLLAEFAEDELPRNAFYGDGAPIEASVLAEIRAAYDEAAVRFEWRRGDVLLVDNFLASHGREPFEGPRKILVAMAELYTNPDI